MTLDAFLLAVALAILLSLAIYFARKAPRRDDGAATGYSPSEDRIDPF